MKKYYIYQTTNLINGKIYVGVHGSENIDKDRYIGSGKLFIKAVKKHGRENFVREILYEFYNDVEAYNLEHVLVNIDFVERIDTYNLREGGKQDYLIGTYVSKLLSIKRKGIPKSKEFKEYLSKKFKGRKNIWNQITNKNPEKIRKMAEKHRGMKRTPETCKNISDSKKGIPLGENSHLFTGYYITPFGKFSSSAKAAEVCEISYTSVIDRCKGRNDCKVVQNTVTKDKHLTKEDIGKTFKELGWSFKYVERNK